MKVWKITLKNVTWGRTDSSVAAPTALAAIDKATSALRRQGMRGFQRRHVIGVELTAELDA